MRAKINVLLAILATLPIWVLAGICYVLYRRTECLYWLNLAIAWDQLANAILGGDPDQCVSSRVWAAHLAGEEWGNFALTLVDGLMSKGHCEGSFSRNM